MKKIKTLIVDDEKLARDVVVEYLSDYEEFEIAGQCSNGFEAIKMLNELKPDLILGNYVKNRLIIKTSS